MSKRINLVERVRVLAGVAVVLSTPFITHAINAYAKAERVNPDAIGGEFLVPVVLLFLAMAIIPQKYMTITFNRYVEEEVAVVDMSDPEIYNEEISLESELFEIIDTDGVSHLFRLTYNEEV